MMTYFEWLSEKTPTRWWHDSAIPAEMEEAILKGALGVTTNPVLSYKSLQAVPQFWQAQVDRIPQSLSPQERAEALLSMVTKYAANRFFPIYERTGKKHGYAFGQLDPQICADSDKMLAQALRYSAWGENIAVKLPTVKAALPVVEELAARGIAVCTTLNFSVSQAIAAGEAYEKGLRRAEKNGILPKPCFVVQQGGRLDDYLCDIARDGGASLAEAEIRNAGITVTKRSYEIFRERGFHAKLMPAGLRGVRYLTELAGADVVFTLQPRVRKMIEDVDPPQAEKIGEKTDLSLLQKLEAIPEFSRAYHEDGLAEADFMTFGVLQRTLSQFLWTGWLPLEAYESAVGNSNWF